MEANPASHFLSPLPSVEARFAAGKKLREKFPRIKQAHYKPANNRADPVSILEEQAKTRLHDLVPIRYARMLASPFSFLRGGAAIMASDLATNKTTVPRQAGPTGRRPSRRVAGIR